MWLQLQVGYLFAVVGLAFSEGLLVPALLGFVIYEVGTWVESTIARRPTASSVP
jgi:hypothetical protein